MQTRPGFEIITVLPRELTLRTGADSSTIARRIARRFFASDLDTGVLFVAARTGKRRFYFDLNNLEEDFSRQAGEIVRLIIAASGDAEASVIGAEVNKFYDELDAEFPGGWDSNESQIGRSQSDRQRPPRVATEPPDLLGPGEIDALPPASDGVGVFVSTGTLVLVCMGLFWFLPSPVAYINSSHINALKR